MASKKKKKARRKSYQQTQTKAPWPTIVAHAAQLLENTKPREAISLLKQALKNGAPSDEVEPQLFQAYLARETQLRNKGMTSEADAVRRQAIKYQPSAASMSATALLALAPGLGDDALITHYLDFLEHQPPDTDVACHVAGRLIIGRQWALLDQLPGGIPLRDEAPKAIAAAEAMHGGEWEKALEAFKGLPRKSPYAPVSLFCRAMCAFYDGEDTAMTRALAMLTENSPLFPLARKLASAPDAISPLWQGSRVAERQIMMLAEHIGTATVKKTVGWLHAAAAALLPQAPRQALRELFELLYPMTLNGRLSRYRLEKLVTRSLDRETARGLLAKFGFFAFQWPLSDLAHYYPHIEREFPLAEETPLAQALVILETLRRLDAGSESSWIQPFHIDQFRRVFGLQADDRYDLKIELNIKALELDPDNRAGYEQLAKWHPVSRQSKNLVERGLRQMVDRFPEDPFPCLALATLYYSKNAFRKAEKVLAEALRRAPHDRQVIERHVLSLLISAHQRLKRGKLELAKQDLDQAAQNPAAALGFIIIEKQLLFRLEQQGQLSLFDGAPRITPKKTSRLVDQALAPLPLFERLQVLGYLVMDSEARKDRWPPAVVREIDKLLRKDLRRYKQLTSGQLVALLQRPPREFEPLTGHVNLAPYYLSCAKTLLSGVNDQDIVAVLDILVDARCFDALLAEIRRRRGKQHSRLNCLLAFYEVAVEQIAHPGHFDPTPFHTVVDSADKSWMELLRAAARRLSSHTNGPLNHALGTFNFNPFSDFMPDFSLFDEEDDGLFNDDEEMDGNDLDYGSMTMISLLSLAETLRKMPMEDILEMDETFLERLRQAMDNFVLENGFDLVPNPVLRMLRNKLRRSDDFVGDLLFSFDQHLDQQTIDHLSPKTRLFFIEKD